MPQPSGGQAPQSDIPVLIDERSKDAAPLRTPQPTTPPEENVEEDNRPAGNNTSDTNTSDTNTSDTNTSGNTGGDNDFPNPFPAQSESEADQSSNDESLNKETPFTGLKLLDEDDTANTSGNSEKTSPGQPMPEFTDENTGENGGENTGAKTNTANDDDTGLTIRSAQQTQQQRRDFQPTRGKTEQAPQPPQDVDAPPLNGAPKETTDEPQPDVKPQPRPNNKPDGSTPADSQDEKLRRIAERRGMSGFRGFCPVVLRDERDLADANPAFRVTFEGKTYYFSSAAAKTAFTEAPEKYAPVQHGRDVVRLAEDGNSVIGSLEHAVWFRDRLYFFASRQTLQTFVKEPAKFAVTDQ